MERERITISIKKHVLKLIDKTIDGVTLRNRSHAIEYLAMKAMGESNSKTALVMLGGDNALKSVPEAKKFISKAQEAGFNKIIIAVGFLGDKVREKIAKENFDIEIEFFSEGEGSGGAVKSLKNDLTNTFVVFNTNKNLDYDLNLVLDFHKKNSALATVATNSISDLDGIYVLDPKVINHIPEGFSMLEEKTLIDLKKISEVNIYPLS